jgi:hypothetical protein
LTWGCEGSVQKDRLKWCEDHAAKAFNTVLDPLDKLAALSCLILALYNRVAFSSLANGTSTASGGEPDWNAGKREAQRLFEQYINKMPELKIAAEEILGKRRIGFIS